MILTDKALEDFYKWYLKKIRERPDIGDRFWDENLISFFENAGHTMQNAFIIEWFDSVLIPIEIRTEYYDGYYFQWLINICDVEKSNVGYESRQEATEEAIKKANEILNARLSQNQE